MQQRPFVTAAGAIAFPAALAFALLAVTRGAGPAPMVLPVLALLPAAALVRRLPLTGLAALLAGSLLTATTVLPGLASLSVTGYAQALVTDVALAYVTAVGPRRRSLPAAAVLLAGQALAAAWYVAGSDHYLAGLVFLALAVVTAALAGDAIRTRRTQAVRSRAEQTDRAVTAERLRIARELHDLVAHSIGVIAIQAGVGARVIDTRPAEARSALGAIEATSRETLSALRRVVGGLRQVPGAGEQSDSSPAYRPPAGLAEVENLAEAARVAGVRFEVRRTGEARDVPADLGQSAYRIVQEAVTNVLRHARARHCVVTIGFAGDELSVEVVDDGRGGEPAPGFGLTGMRERAELLAGRFSAGPRPGGGFRVAAALPLPARSR